MLYILIINYTLINDFVQIDQLWPTLIEMGQIYIKKHFVNNNHNHQLRI